MSKEIIIDKDPTIWVETIHAMLFNKTGKCPHCSSSNIDFEAIDFGKGIGYATATCNECNKTGYISRMKFPAGANVVIKAS